MRDANLHAFHNTVRKLYNIEWAQLDFLTDAQKDNFFANPPRFFISADDETAAKLWDVMFPKPPEAKSGVKDAGGVVVDLERYRLAGETEWRRRWGYKPDHTHRWSPEVRIGGLPPMQESDGSGRVYTYLINGSNSHVTACEG